jgi:hypothetical protein
MIEEEQHLKQAVKNNHVLASSLFIDKEHKICYENREGYIARERAADECASHPDISLAFFFHLPAVV